MVLGSATQAQCTKDSSTSPDLGGSYTAQVYKRYVPPPMNWYNMGCWKENNAAGGTRVIYNQLTSATTLAACQTAAAAAGYNIIGMQSTNQCVCLRSGYRSLFAR